MQALAGVRGLRGILSAAATSGLAAGASLALVRAAAAPGAMAVAAAGGPLAWALPGGAALPAAVLAGAALCGWLGRRLGRLERQFVFTDYTHFDK